MKDILCSKEFYFSCVISCTIRTLEAETEGLLVNVRVGCKMNSRRIETLKPDLVSTKDWACTLVVEKPLVWPLALYTQIGNNEKLKKKKSFHEKSWMLRWLRDGFSSQECSYREPEFSSQQPPNTKSKGTDTFFLSSKAFVLYVFITRQAHT